MFTQDVGAGLPGAARDVTVDLITRFVAPSAVADVPRFLTVVVQDALGAELPDAVELVVRIASAELTTPDLQDLAVPCADANAVRLASPVSPAKRDALGGLDEVPVVRVAIANAATK